LFYNSGIGSNDKPLLKIIFIDYFSFLPGFADFAGFASFFTDFSAAGAFACCFPQEAPTL
jgi:hypothetical protein